MYRQLMQSKIDSSVNFLGDLGTADSHSIDSVIDNIEKSSAHNFLTNLLHNNNDFCTILSNALVRHYANFVIYSDDTLGGKEFLFTDHYSEKEIVDIVKSIPVEQLFTLTISQHVCETIIDNAESSKNTQGTLPVFLGKNTTTHYSYFLHDILSAIGYQRTSEILKAKGRKAIIHHLLNTTTSEMASERIGSIICINAIMKAYSVDPDITTRWFAENLKSLSNYPALFRVVLGSISTHFRTKKMLKVLILKCAFKALTPYEFNSLISGYINEEYRQYEGLKDAFYLGGNRHDGNANSVNALKEIMLDIGSRKKDIPENIDMLMEAQKNGFYLPPELMIKGIVRTGRGWHSDLLSSIVGLETLNADQLNWLTSQIKQAGYTDFNLAMSSVLGNPCAKHTSSSAEQIQAKVNLILELANSVGEYLPSSYTLERALNSNIESVIHTLFPLLELDCLSNNDWDIITGGISIETPENILEIAANYLSPFLEEVGQDKNEDNDPFVTMRNLLGVKKSLVPLANVYFKRKISSMNKEELVVKIGGKKQLGFYLNAADLDPYTLISMNVSDKINKMCFELMAE